MNENNLDDVGKGIMSVIVRCIGLFLLLVGVYVALQVMLKAMELYEEPKVIERFASAIETGSNIDKSLSSIRASAGSDTEETLAPAAAGDSDATAPAPAVAKPQTPVDDNVRISYFFAWIIVLMLLMLIGSISLRAIKTGGELVLYDMQIKQFAKMLVKESGKINH